MADKKRVARPPPLVNSVIKIISKAIVVEPFLSPRMLVSLYSYYMRFSRGGEYFLRFFPSYFSFFFLWIWFLSAISFVFFRAG